MLLGDTGVYAGTQGYPLFTMSRLRAALTAALPPQAVIERLRQKDADLQARFRPA